MGPASAVADRIATYNGTSGTVIKDGGKLITDLALVSHTHTAAQVTDFSEAVDDRVGALLVAGTNITLNYNDAANSLTINGSGAGAASGITVTPAGNIAATDVQAALVELDTEKVAKAGDTMTGNLLINKSNPSLVLQKTAFTGQANQLAGYNGANPRWSLALGDSTNEGGSSSGSDFTLYRYTDAGGLLDAPFTITRSNGNVTLTGMLTLSATAPSTGNHATNKTYVDNAIAASGGGSTGC